MAGESLGTMTVGVAADVSPAERALNNFAQMLETFERRMAAPRVRQKPIVKIEDFIGPLTPEQQIGLAEERQAKSDSIASKLRFRQIQQSERQAASQRQLVDRLQVDAERELAQEKKTQEAKEKQLQRHIDRLHDLAIKKERAIKAAAESKGWDMSTWQDMPAVEQTRMARTAPQMEQMDAHVREFQRRRVEELHHVEASANRVRYGMMNLAYGVQDAATVFGTSGFAGAIRASANNLQGFGVLLAEAKNGIGGLGSALMSAEFGVVGISTALMIGADLWAQWEQRAEQAAEKAAKLNMKRFQPQQGIDEAGRKAGFKAELEAIDSVAQAQNRLDNSRVDMAVNEAKAVETRKQAQTAIIEGDKLKRLLAHQQYMQYLRAEGMEQELQAQGLEAQKSEALVESLGGEAAVRKMMADYYSQAEELETKYQQMLRERGLIVAEQGALEKTLKEQQAKADKEEMDKKNERLDKEAQKKAAELDKRGLQYNEDVERARQTAVRDYEMYVKSIEQDVGRLSQRVQSYDPTEGIGGAAFGSAEAFDALGKARQGPSPDSQALQDMRELLRNANNNLNDIRLNTLPSMKAEDEAEMVRKAHNLLFNNALSN